MTNTNELDTRLRTSINAPNSFLDSVALVNALHNSLVLASDQPYALEIDGQKVTSILSDKDDLEAFRTKQDSTLQQNWVKRSTPDVLREVIGEGLTGLVLSLKKTGDSGDSTIFKNSGLIQFLNTYTTILNKLMEEESLVVGILDKYCLVPAFVHLHDDKNFDRTFPTISTPGGKSCVPAFLNLQSFAKWYNHSDSGLPFRKAQGNVLTWRLADIYQPGYGENDVDRTVGVAVNPFGDQQVLASWSDIDENE